MALGSPSPSRVRLARSLALAADFLQVIAFPILELSPLSDVLDFGVAIVMTVLLGWHWAFLPTLIAEFLPVIDLFPTWTFAVFYVTRGQARDVEMPEEPRPIKDVTPEQGPVAGTPAESTTSAQESGREP